MIDLRDKVSVLEQLLSIIAGTYGQPRCPLGSDEDSPPPPPAF
jgi:hypothetical protein